MRYTLTAPLVITSRLMPGMRLGDGTVSLAITGRGTDGRVVIGYFIDYPGGSYQGVSGGPWTGDEDEMIRRAASALLSFLGAEAEDYGRAQRRGTDGPADGWLFDAAVAQWASDNADEIAMAQEELNGDGDD